MNPARILIVDDDVIVAGSLAEFLRAEGHDAGVAAEAEGALEALGAASREGRPYGLVICDVCLPGGAGGQELLERIARSSPAPAVVMLTGYATVESAVQCLRMGAADYLTKPVMDGELRVAVERAISRQALMADGAGGGVARAAALDGLIGSDHRVLKTFELIEAVAPSRTTVLMTGESGVGKSLVAHAIHRASPRREGPFVELSCGSIPETLLESELFGHVKGAFTGAHTDKPGRFLSADGGTIFLDEINSASPGMQLKLLRVLQERRFEPVGSARTVEVDVRVVLASNQALEELVAQGAFRQDLYYRINVVKIELPPLRERAGDIPRLAEHFLGLHARELGKQVLGFTEEAMSALRAYRFPGNVRELANIVERAAVLTRRPTIRLEDLPEHVVRPGMAPAARDGAAEVSLSLEAALREPERRIILGALKANNWNRQRTADQLGINRTTLYKKMKALGLDGAAMDAA